MGWQTLEVLEHMLEEERISCDYARDGWLDVVMKPENMAHAEAEARSLAASLERPGRLRFLIARGRNHGATISGL